MNLPDRNVLEALLHEHVKDEYQLHHAKMVATAMEGYARLYGEDEDLWYATGLLHDIDYEEYPEEHPGKSLAWFKEWGYPEDMIHAVEAHVYGYHGYEVLPVTRLASALMACDEISGIFYAYRKLNPIPYGEMKAGSIRKRLGEKSFASKIDRIVVERGVNALGVTLDEHITNLIKFFKGLD